MPLETGAGFIPSPLPPKPCLWCGLTIWLPDITRGARIATLNSDKPGHGVAAWIYDYCAKPFESFAMNAWPAWH